VKRVIWTRQAVEDVEAIKAYVARDSERYAVLLAERLVAATDVWGSSQSRAVSFRKSVTLGCVKSCTATTESSTGCSLRLWKSLQSITAHACSGCSTLAHNASRRPNNRLNPAAGL
jgi:hypothetical protein